MEDLQVFDRDTHHGLAEHLAEQRTWRRSDATIRNAGVLEALALHAGPEGEIRASLRSIAKIMCVHHSHVARGLKDLEECGAITIDGDLATYARHYSKEFGYVGWEWKDRPSIIINPMFRATDSTRRLGA